MIIPEISFPDYLEAKKEVDDSALNSTVRERLLSAIRHVVTEQTGTLRILDLGTGTGAMVRRLLRDLGSVQSAGMDLEILGVDIDQNLVETAKRLGAEDWVESGSGSRHSAGSGEVKIEFRVMSVDKALAKENSCELITAHALMDLLPMAATCAAVHRSLVPGGLFYATINYNGLTRWYPKAEDAEFEQQLLSYYDRSMRRVREDGREQDGASSGGQLYEACSAAGLEVLALGGSDWCVFPKVDVGTAAYTGGERSLLAWMLGNIYREGLQEFPASSMDTWMSGRLHCLQQERLAMVVHHLDVLARRRFP
ncbi:MAG: class I SAM-dependent methyltransferase [Spirochaetaceae bacterium]|nr:MAG: class I SAM-dependent methyltransferase [Spirochaetaceae bacterium]